VIKFVMNALGHDLFDITEIKNHSFITATRVSAQFPFEGEFKTVPVTVRVTTLVFMVRDSVAHIPLYDFGDFNALQIN